MKSALMLRDLDEFISTGDVRKIGTIYENPKLFNN